MKKIIIVLLILISASLCASSSADKAITSYNKGCQFLSAGKLPEALKYLNTAIKLDSVNPNFWEGRGDVYFSMKNFTAAISDYTKAMSLAPNIGLYYTKRALAYQAIGNINAMYADLVMAANLGEPIAQRVIMEHQSAINAKNQAFRENFKQQLQSDIETRFGYKPGTITW